MDIQIHGRNGGRDLTGDRCRQVAPDRRARACTEQPLVDTDRRKVDQRQDAGVSLDVGQRPIDVGCRDDVGLCRRDGLPICIRARLDRLHKVRLLLGQRPDSDGPAVVLRLLVVGLLDDLVDQVLIMRGGQCLHALRDRLGLIVRGVDAVDHLRHHGVRNLVMLNSHFLPPKKSAHASCGAGAGFCAAMICCAIRSARASVSIAGVCG